MVEKQKETCMNCGNDLPPTGIFYIMGWRKSHPDVSLDDEIRHDFNVGPICGVCFAFKADLVERSNSPIDKKM